MKGCPDRLHRIAKQRRECARDSVGDVGSLPIINVHIDERSDVPLENWQDHLKRQRRKKKQPGPTEPPAAPGRQPPDSLIDDYAAPS